MPLPVDLGIAVAMHWAIGWALRLSVLYGWRF